MNNPLRILVADDHEVIREGLRALLERQTGWVVCGEAGTGREALTEALRLKPDIVIMDISMPELNGLDATPQILEHLPDTRVMILSAHDSERLIRHMLSSGARGYMLKTDAGRNLVAAVEALAQGQLFFTGSVSKVILGAHQVSQPDTLPSSDFDVLTARERQILKLLAEGMTNKQVAAKINVSVKTVETHRSRLMGKLDLHSLTDLVRYAIQHEIILS
jgi:DNA-binding NarL/FixJ family response regulator